MSAPIRMAAHAEPALVRDASLSAADRIKTPVTGTSASFCGKQQSFTPFFLLPSSSECHTCHTARTAAKAAVALCGLSGRATMRSLCA